MTAPGRHWTVTTAGTPKRDIDLFGPTTVRLDATVGTDGAPVPMLYLSAYVDDPEAFAQRVRGALAWADNTLEPPATAKASGFSMPEFVEDVVWTERLPLPEDLTTADWKGWTEAMLRRIRLAVTARQLADLEAINHHGLKNCPSALRSRIGKALAFTHEDVRDQAA